jgi:PIN domain nuclease of toxin-antitoxin system
VKLLLDTHTLLWFLDDAPQLSLKAKQLIEDPVNSKHVSMVVCWEIAIKAGLKKLDLSEPASTFLPRHLAINHFGLLGIELTHVMHVEDLPLHHRDPFDRLLAAQSLLDDYSLVSKDAIFDQYGVKRIW